MNRSQLIQLAQGIRDETEEKANTAERVGTLFTRLVQDGFLPEDFTPTIEQYQQTAAFMDAIRDSFPTEIMEDIEALKIEAQALKDSLQWRGAFDPDATYAKDNRVSFGGSSFISLQNYNTRKKR